MPIITNFTLPHSAEGLNLPSEPSAVFFIAFLASTDPSTGKPWCPDVVAALPYLQNAFAADTSPQAAFVEVGLRPEWRDPSNVCRAKWNVSAVPTLMRYKRINGKIQAVGKLVEGEILDQKQLDQFINTSL